MKNGIFMILLVLLLFVGCQEAGIKTVYLPYDPGPVVGNIELIGEWVREASNQRWVFDEGGNFLLRNATTGEINNSGTWSALTAGQIDFIEDNTTEFIYFYTITYDSPSPNYVTLSMKAEFVPGALWVDFYKQINGVYVYP